jgi:hypothetical protein
VLVEELGERANGDVFDHCERPDSVVEVDRGYGFVKAFSFSGRNQIGSGSRRSLWKI